MHLRCCEHPQRVLVNGHYQYVPCGKCNTCRNNHASQWVDRLETERQCWKYCVFVTLTYDEHHVPQMLYTKDGLLYDFDNDFVVDPSEVSGFDYRSRVYLHRRKHINYLSVRDFQLFLKRLRYYVSSINDSFESRTIRYFLSTEYGPTTLRPHAHCLFFFNSDQTASHFSEIVSKAWKNGGCPWSFVKSNAADYCAKYVNSIYCLPKVYLHRQLCPFILCSKCPFIGSLFDSTQEIFEIFNRASVTHGVFRRKRNEIVHVPLLRSTRCSLFPKVQGFSMLTHLDRVALYSIARFSQAENFEEFRTFVSKIISVDSAYYSSWMQQLSKLFYSDTHYPLMNLWQISNRVVYQSLVFDCTVDYYVCQIEKFYKNYDYYKLKKQLEFEQDFAERYGPQSLIYLDESFVENMLDFLGEFDPFDCSAGLQPLVDEYRMIVETYGLDFKEFVTNSAYRFMYHPIMSNDFRLMVSSSAEMIRRSSKTKKKNDYLLAHPECAILTF